MARILVILAVLGASFGVTADEQHHHGADKKKPVQRPRIFLDKSPRIVEYQLRRLDNERLLFVERRTDHAKYAPVWSAILSRAGMSPQHREEALAALVKINRSSPTAELLKAIEPLEPGDPQQRRTARALASLLLRQPAATLKAQEDLLDRATRSGSSLVRSVGHAGLVIAGRTFRFGASADANDTPILDWLAAVPLVPDAVTRSRQREQVARLVAPTRSLEVRRAAIRALRSIPASQAETYRLVAPLVAAAELRTAAVRTLLKIPAKHRDPETSRALVEVLVEHAEMTPASDRTTDVFLDAMQLADQSLARLPAAIARDYRGRLRAVTVRVVRIRTVEEEMRYDTDHFAVEAGRPVQVVLENEDLMPHNLVVTVPGALREVAELGLAAGPEGHGGKGYVPDSDKVLFATGMVQPQQRERLTFTAPGTPGEYPYVCTFPRHWVRMYGVMVVVEDLDAWLADPQPPKDPLGSNRQFVKAWTLDDFEDLDAGLRGRNPEIGRRIFTEAACAQCHKLHGEGGAVGPDLTEVLERWKGDRRGVLREILDPSHKVDPKYAVHVAFTATGKVVSGIVQSETRDELAILENPEAEKATVIRRSDLVQLTRTSQSIMPRGLLDRFIRDEILELLALLESASKSN